MQRLAFIVIAFLVGTAPVTAQQNETAKPGAEEPAAKVEVNPTTDDSQISERLTGIMQTTDWFSGIQVSVREGVVFIDGTTTSIANKEWAGSLAKNTKDVVAVVNRIDVEPRPDFDFTPAMKQLQFMWRSFVSYLPLTAFAIVVLGLSWFLASLVSRLTRPWFERKSDSKLLGSLIARLLAVPVFLVGLFIVLQTLGLTRLALTIVGGTGALGIVAGFAFRDIAENFLASVLLSIRRPFQLNDFVHIDGHAGLVRALTTRSTMLMTVDGDLVQIPNATVYKNTITNKTANPASRADFVIGIGFEHSIVKAQEIVLEVTGRHEAVLPDPAPWVLVDELGSSTIQLRVYFWFTFKTYSRVKVASSLMRQCLRELERQGITAPDDAREIIFPDGVPLTRGQRPSHVNGHASESDVRRNLDLADDRASSDEELASDHRALEKQAEQAERHSDEVDLLRQS